MSKLTIKEAPVKPRPEVDVEVLASLCPELLFDGYIYVHCHLRSVGHEALIRIWKTTFLIDRTGGARSALVHAENITFAPLWTMITDESSHTFLLIFESLPKSCAIFDLVEEISQPGGFHIENIRRNGTDVYHIDL